MTLSKTYWHTSRYEVLSDVEHDQESSGEVEGEESLTGASQI